MSKKIDTQKFEASIFLSLVATACLMANPISIEKIVVNTDAEQEALYMADTNLSATITTPDNVLSASTTSSTYQTGAPFGMFVSLNLQY